MKICCHKKDIYENKNQEFFCLCCYKTLRHSDIINYTKHENTAICNFCKANFILSNKPSINDADFLRLKRFGKDSKADGPKFVSIKNRILTLIEISGNNKLVLANYHI
jgi:hypothetical protein